MRRVSRLAVMRRLNRRIRLASKRHIRRIRRLNRIFLSLPPARRTRRLLNGMINAFAKRVRSALPVSRARKLHARLGADLRGQLYTFRRTHARLQYDNLYSGRAAQAGAKLRRSLIRRLRANRLHAKAPVRVLRKRHFRPRALRITRLRRANLRVRRAVQRQRGLIALSSASRGTKL
jgi:hypothetical protein